MTPFCAHFLHMVGTPFGSETSHAGRLRAANERTLDAHMLLFMARGGGGLLGLAAVCLRNSSTRLCSARSSAVFRASLCFVVMYMCGFWVALG